MRRTFVLASVFTTLLLGATACGDDSGSPTATASSAAPKTSTVDKKTTCDNLAALQASAGMKMVNATNEMLKTISETDAAKKQEAMNKALELLKASTAEYKAGLEKEAAQVSDAELKPLLASASAGMTQFHDQVSKITTLKSMDDIPEGQNKEAEEALDKIMTICGK